MALTSVSPTARSSDRPTSVEPVKAILSTPGWRARASPMTAPRTGHDVEDAVGQAGLGRQLGEPEGASAATGWRA